MSKEDYKPMTKEELLAKFDIPIEFKKEFYKVLKDLEKEGTIIKSANEHGFIAEQVDNKTMSPAWVNGLAWAHAMFVTISTTH